MIEILFPPNEPLMTLVRFRVRLIARAERFGRLPRERVEGFRVGAPVLNERDEFRGDLLPGIGTRKKTAKRVNEEEEQEYRCHVGSVKFFFFFQMLVRDRQ